MKQLINEMTSLYLSHKAGYKFSSLCLILNVMFTEQYYF